MTPDERRALLDQTAERPPDPHEPDPQKEYEDAYWKEQGRRIRPWLRRRIIEFAEADDFKGAADLILRESRRRR